MVKKFVTIWKNRRIVYLRRLSGNLFDPNKMRVWNTSQGFAPAGKRAGAQAKCNSGRREFYGNGYLFLMLAAKLQTPISKERNGSAHKIRNCAVMRVKRNSGEHLCTNLPYGYRN